MKKMALDGTTRGLGQEEKMELKMEGQKDNKTKKCATCQLFMHGHDRLFIGLLFY